MSKDIGLFGRKPVYPNISSLVQSYAAPYIDRKANIEAYGVLDLRTLKNQSWRTSRKNVWYVEEALRQIPHRRLKLAKAFVQHWRRRYLQFKKQRPKRQPDFYPGKKYWL
jgi:hypothetical protein